MREQEERHPQHFRGWVGFSIPVAHRIVAGMMPSALLTLIYPPDEHAELQLQMVVGAFYWNLPNTCTSASSQLDISMTQICEVSHIGRSIQH